MAIGARVSKAFAIGNRHVFMTPELDSGSALGRQN